MNEFFQAGEWPVKLIEVIYMLHMISAFPNFLITSKYIFRIKKNSFFLDVRSDFEAPNSEKRCCLYHYFCWFMLRSLCVWSTPLDFDHFERSRGWLLLHSLYADIHALEVCVFRQDKWVHIRWRWVEQDSSVKRVSVWQYLQEQVDTLPWNSVSHRSHRRWILSINRYCDERR